MHLAKSPLIKNILVLITVWTVLLSACEPARPETPTVLPPTAEPTHTPPPVPSPSPTNTPVPLPKLTLQEGDMYFSLDGVERAIFARNLGGYQVSQYAQLLGLTRQGGSLVARLQIDSMGMGYTRMGQLDEIWLRKWEMVLNDAEAKGIYVIPVFAAWFDWNNGTPDYGYSTWKSNPLNQGNRGPAGTPAELFQKDSVTQKLWLNWMKTIVERWQGRRNIAAWEIFSEVNLATGATEQNGTAFVEEAARLIRAADPTGRPITASLADMGEWSSFYRSDAIDFINLHPYPPSARLDTYILSLVHKKLDQYGKPVLIGESGLSAAVPDSEAGKITVAEHADRGVRHAIWAMLVSGSMNGRMLYWEDGFGIYFPSLEWPFLNQYAEIESAAVDFSKDIDFAGFEPLPAQHGGGITGATLGNEEMVIGWFRDAGCEPPDWPLKPVISGQKVTLTVPGAASEWQVDFYNTQTGVDILSSALITRQGDMISVLLPDFTDDIAFKLYPQP
jgi:hypothetical protein